MDMPPTRYKVVERGRRLIVVDRLHGGTPVGSLQIEKATQLDRRRQPMQAPRPDGGARRPRSGSEPGVLVTRRWFDDKGPRRLRLTDESRMTFGVVATVLVVLALVVTAILQWLVLPVLAFFLFQPKVRQSLRKASTVWLDSLDEA